ncbi:hypothetical protein [Pandoraea cepalis]|uniref:hypothetical protein n=1 Tax=Pandoraea cepalis TaxID=2508294 RepID=UPI00123F98F4|nr:hypothetical protein [Pandoraea cepalis]
MDLDEVKYRTRVLAHEGARIDIEQQLVPLVWISKQPERPQRASFHLRHRQLGKMLPTSARHDSSISARLHEFSASSWQAQAAATTL